MRRGTGKGWRWAGIVLLCIAPAAYSEDVTMSLVGVGAGNVLAGVYTSPYTAVIDNGMPTYAICDDFIDDSFVGETWSATGSTVADLGTSTKWASNPPTALQQQNYDEAAWLVNQLLLPANSDAATLGEISFAIWNIFDSGSNGAIAYLANYYGSKSAYVTQAQAWQNKAALNYNDGSVDFASMSVYTPLSSPAPTCSGPGCPAGGIQGLPQEFLVVTPRVSTPEPSALASLGASFLGFGFVVYFLRRRIVLKNFSAPA